MTKYESVDVSAIVVIDEWSGLDEALAGSRAKQSFINPETDDYFIFKEPNDERRLSLIWSELIASYIAGDLLGWPVQHVQIALKNGKIGNLLRYIYEPKKEQMVAGERLCLHYDENFDVKAGTRHSWELILKICHEFREDAFKTEETKGIWTIDFIRYWSRAIAFDTLISNSDRHAENWSLILPLTEEGGGSASSLLAPFYDNGSSMGCEVDPVGLDRWFDQKGQIIPAKLEKYCRRGRHHLRGPAGRFHFEGLCKVALETVTLPTPKRNPFREEFEAVANLDLSKLDVLFDDIQGMQGLPESAKITEYRQLQITELLRIGQERVKRSLEDTL